MHSICNKYSFQNNYFHTLNFHILTFIEANNDWSDDSSDHIEITFHVRNRKDELCDLQNGRNVRRNLGNHVWAWLQVCLDPFCEGQDLILIVESYH